MQLYHRPRQEHVQVKYALFATVIHIFHRVFHSVLCQQKYNYFATHKGVDIRVKIHNFDLPQHDVLEGRVIRCSDNEGLYIVGCQMPGDDFFIRDYVKGKL